MVLTGRPTLAGCLVQLSSRADGRVHRLGIIEEGQVDAETLAWSFLVADQGLEAVAPQDLVR